jgi:hypothetical protein
MPDDEFWLPLVDEPIGEIVSRIQAEDTQLTALVSSPRRQLAFKTFAYIRVGLLLGQILVDHDVDTTLDQTWVEQLLADPKHYEAVKREVRAVADEIARDPQLADDDLGPDPAARERFRAFARRLGS